MDDTMRINVRGDGPYAVSGAPLLRAEIVANDVGESESWRELGRVDTPDRYILCRCGKSCEKPFCDGSHVAVGFDGTETAEHDRYFEQAVCTVGPGLKLRDVRKLCAEARFCDRAGGLWNLIEDVEDPKKRALVEEEAADCPSGRYVVCEPDTDAPHEPVLEPSIALVDDPKMQVSGPLFVRGGVQVYSAAGEAYEVRNRVTLCRCGYSRNKPFCDGSHIGAGFREHE